jgi:hypothetical protein
VKRLVAWVGGVAGGIAAYRLLKRRPEPAPQPPATAEPEPDDRAEELREKLAESRTAEPPVEGAPAEAEAAEPEPESPEDRRRRVHEEGRSTLDDMNSE